MGSYLIEVEHEVQLAHVTKELIQHFYEEVYGLEICQLIVVGVYTRTEEEPCISPVYDLGRPAEFDKVGLVFLISRSYKAVDLGKSDRLDYCASLWGVPLP